MDEKGRQSQTNLGLTSGSDAYIWVLMIPADNSPLQEIPELAIEEHRFFLWIYS